MKIKTQKLVAHKNALVPEFISLGLQEKRFLAYCIAQLNPKHDKTLCQIQVKISDIADVFGIAKTNVYPRIKEAARLINNKPVERITEKSYCIDFWFKRLKIIPESGTITIHFNEYLEPLLLDLKSEYLQYPLKMAAGFNNASWSLYEVLKQWETTKNKCFTLDELKEIFNAVGKYPRWNNFKARLIDPSIQNINEVSDLHVTYEKEKEGRKVVGLVFFIDSKEKRQDSITVDADRDKLYKSLLHYGVNEKTASDYSGRAERQGQVSWIEKRLPAIKERYDKKRPDIPFQKYLLGALKDEFNQGNLLYQKPEKKIIEPDERDYLPALNCWQEKRRQNEECAVRKRGHAGQRKKCQICLEKIPVQTWGL